MTGSRDDRIKNLVKSIAPRSALPLIKQLRRVVRKARRAFMPALTRESLLADLRKAGITPGMTVMVHSSLARIGSVRGGADAVIDSVTDAVTGSGTIVMPAFGTASEAIESSRQSKPVDLRYEPSQTGHVSEVFRTRAGVSRSSHPFSSVCAWGRRGHFVTSGHELGETICHPQSPFGRLLELDGLILGLGTGLGTVSFYHAAEDMWGEFPFETHAPAQAVSYVDAQGNLVTRNVSHYLPELAKTRIETERGRWLRELLGENLRKKGILRDFHYGNAAAWVMPARLLFEELKILARQGITIYTPQEEWLAANKPAPTANQGGSSP